jgi:hypothetical protein
MGRGIGSGGRENRGRVSQLVGSRSRLRRPRTDAILRCTRHATLESSARFAEASERERDEAVEGDVSRLELELGLGSERALLTPEGVVRWSHAGCRRCCPCRGCTDAPAVACADFPLWSLFMLLDGLLASRSSLLLGTSFPPCRPVTPDSCLLSLLLLLATSESSLSRWPPSCLHRRMYPPTSCR